MTQTFKHSNFSSRGSFPLEQVQQMQLLVQQHQDSIQSKVTCYNSILNSSQINFSILHQCFNSSQSTINFATISKIKIQNLQSQCNQSESKYEQLSELQVRAARQYRCQYKLNKFQNKCQNQVVRFSDYFYSFVKYQFFYSQVNNHFRTRESFLSNLSIEDENIKYQIIRTIQIFKST